VRTIIKYLFVLQTVLLAASIISRMVLVKPGYVPAHAIDYYVSSLQAPLSVVNSGPIRDTRDSLEVTQTLAVPFKRVSTNNVVLKCGLL
jgi:hypothetical protein